MKRPFNAKVVTTMVAMLLASPLAAAQTFDGVLTKRTACQARISGDKNCSTLPKPSGKACSVTLNGSGASFDIADLPDVQNTSPHGRTGQNHEQMIYTASSSSKNLVFVNTGSIDSTTPRSFEVKADYTISKADYRDYSYESYLCSGLKRRTGAPKTVSRSAKGAGAAQGAAQGDRATGGN